MANIEVKLVYGPTIYASLGYGTSLQLLLAACWVGAAFIGSALSMVIVDRVPRPKLMAGGMIACVIVLTVECILIARNPIGPDVNPAALKAAVAMIFCRSTLYLMIQKTEAYTSNSVCSLLRVHEQRPARLPGRDLPIPPPV